ncbi:MAG: family 10 glycosylhydrolase [Lachnospiraceae bacterium]|nr:family 10 glycosylhydrolase [Lachnospiraceae bacterium]
MKKTVKKLVAFMLVCVLLFTTGNFGVSTCNAQAANNMRGVWLSFIDQQQFLRGKGQADYDAAFRAICQTAASKGLNTIFVHVRSHNDAIYPSSIYPWSSQMLLGVDPGFDPLADMVKIAHESGLQIHAWINPYGYRNKMICGNPALATNDNIVAGVNEILDRYAVDGIHFDDYFPPIGASNINSMVSRVHQTCAAHGKVFGIAPQGNIQNCLASGADVVTWLSTPGYVDYIAPQIYWTDNYGAAGNNTMSSTRLAAWKSLDKAGIPMYVGMALYRSGSPSSSDPGWVWNTNNLAKQSAYAQSLGYTGYILYNTASLMAPNAYQAQELASLR